MKAAVLKEQSGVSAITTGQVLDRALESTVKEVATNHAKNGRPLINLFQKHNGQAEFNNNNKKGIK